MLTRRPRWAWTAGSLIRRMYPAQTIRSGAIASMRANSAASNARRVAWSRGSSAMAGIPAARARCSAVASRRSENTPTISTPSRPAAIASISACRLLPRPDTSTAMRKGRESEIGTRGADKRRSADVDAICAGVRDDFSDPAVRQAQAIEICADGGDIAGRHDEHEAHAAIERPPHFFVGDRTFALQPVEHRWQHDRRRLDPQAKSLGNDADDVLGQAAAGDVRHRMQVMG